MADPVVEVSTNFGTFEITLDPGKAPTSVANFLAYVDAKHYDGTIFHRVIPEFMIQGGDPLGVGMGGPGYQFGDEISERKHDKPGTLSMANAGPGTNGSQFFITEKPTPFLDGKHTVFGHCAEVDLVKKITGVPRDSNDKPNTDVVLQKITISRKPKK